MRKGPAASTPLFTSWLPKGDFPAMLALAAATLGAPQRPDGTTSLMQFTNPPKEAEDATAATMNVKTNAAIPTFEHHDSGPEDCSLPMHKCHSWSMPEIRKLFTHGTPSNALANVGLMLHGFDGTLQGGGNNGGSLTEYNVTGEKDVVQGQMALPWAPCDKGWCENSAKWLSTSIVSSEHRAGFSDGGMILKPSANKVLTLALTMTLTMNADPNPSPNPNPNPNPLPLPRCCARTTTTSAPWKRAAMAASTATARGTRPSPPRGSRRCSSSRRRTSRRTTRCW